MPRKPPLSLIVSRASSTDPPASLGQAGSELWRRVMAAFEFSDPAGLIMLEQAAQALDRAETLRAEIERDGAILRGRAGAVKDHPGLRHELQNRAFVVRTLHKLGLDAEPLRPAPGRPPRGIGWQPP
jgi:hypothetical protein